MAKTVVLYRLDTHELDGLISVSNDADVEIQQYDPKTHAMIEIDPNHPVIGEQHAWRMKQGVLERKSEAEIALSESQRQQQEHARKGGPSVMEMLLAEINALRSALNLPIKTIDEVRRAANPNREPQ